MSLGDPKGFDPDDDGSAFRSDDTVIGELLESNELEKIRAVIAAHSGPLPSPQTLADYDRVLPGLANRIVSLAEKEQDHRHSLQNTTITGGLDVARRGQRYGLGVVLAVLVFAGALILSGYGTEGAIIASVDLVALASVFVIGQRSAASLEKRRSQSSS